MCYLIYYYYYCYCYYRLLVPLRTYKATFDVAVSAVASCKSAEGKETWEAPGKYAQSPYSHYPY